MRNITTYLLLTILFLLPSCDVHEFPKEPNEAAYHLRLTYDTDFIVWNHPYNSRRVESSKGVHSSGQMRYIVRAYPLHEGDVDYTDFLEYRYTQDVSKGYDFGTDIELPTGDYQLMVWSDLVQYPDQTPFYLADDFLEITLQGEYQGANDYKDAFRGIKTYSIRSSVVEQSPDTIDVNMQRPLGKIELLSTDLDQFAVQELSRLEAIAKAEGRSLDEVESRFVIDNYKIVFSFQGFMPNQYSMFTDKPVYSLQGLGFETTMKKLNESEASLGFDYVLVNGNESAVNLKISIYDEEGTWLTTTPAFDVPVKRSHHTVMRGKFLTTEAGGGVSINPEFVDDYNIIFP